jgi:hypothetical protein
VVLVVQFPMLGHAGALKMIEAKETNSKLSPGLPS